MAATLAPAALQAPSQQTNHGDSGTAPSVVKPGSVYSATKSAKICDFMALRFSKSTTCSDNSIAHLLILPKLSLFSKISFNG
jgi:hypothetical protein